MVVSVSTVMSANCTFVGFHWSSEYLLESLDWRGVAVILLFVLHPLGDLHEIGSRSGNFAASLFYNRISGGPKGFPQGLFNSSNAVHRLGNIPQYSFEIECRMTHLK